MSKPYIDYTAFQRPTFDEQRIWIWLTTAITVLVIGTAAAPQSIAIWLTAFGTLLVTVWVKKQLASKQQPWRVFAKINGFTFNKAQGITDNPALLHIKPEPVTIDAYYITGEFSGRTFRLGITELRGLAHSPHRYRSTYFGVLKVTLRTNFPHIVLDTLSRDWQKQDAQLAPGFAGVTVAPYSLYVLPGTLGGVPSPQALSQFAQQVSETAEVDIEINGNALYFVQKDGIAQTPQAVERFFKLIELVDVLDPPTDQDTR